MSVRLVRSVDRHQWCLDDALGLRRLRLLEVPEPEDLLRRVIDESKQASENGSIRLEWKESSERRGYFRLVAQILLSETTFDQFFNGRSGYRAQYYLSPEEGILFNRDILQALLPVLAVAHSKAHLSVNFDLIGTSLLAPHAKVWVFEEQAAFNDAADNALNPPRWVENGATRGRRAPLPSHHMLELKGSFLHLTNHDLFVDDLKLDRAWDLHMRGYT